MKEMFTTSLGRFRLIATLEGISFLVLLGIAMPLKYLWYQPEMVEYTGMAHGVLFVLYILAVIGTRAELKWGFVATVLGLFMSFVPFGTFYVTAKMMPSEDANTGGDAQE